LNSVNEISKAYEIETYTGEKMAVPTYLGGRYDVIVIGGGHAGCEAALAAARMGVKTLLITMSPDSIAMAPCNPAIGGPAKSVVVREIDALGGAMGRITDAAQIQIRMLNTGKGPAVQALRAQIDKQLYQRLMRAHLERQDNLFLRMGEVTELLIEGDDLLCGQVRGCRLKNGIEYLADRVIICSGTYLDGRVLIGEYDVKSGPAGFPPATDLGLYLRSIGLPMRRFKTGTPARIDQRSIDFDKTAIQPGQPDLFFSYMTRKGEFDRPNIPCWMTYTNERTHEIIRANLHLAPLYSGRISGIGPRYCPSIEDKVVRFAERDSHQLFLEPEGEHTREYYVQGMSTSLPERVQVAFLRTIPGLEECELIRPAYAIEYDCIDPTQLQLTLEHKTLRGLFMAGQVNGSSGYEEAAAQGLMAAVNAAAQLKGLPPFILSRAESYIGVMIDDLVTKGVSEPYRLMTSLAEYRLLLRQDNADMRLTEKGLLYALINDEQRDFFYDKKQLVEAEVNRLETEVPHAAGLAQLGVENKPLLTLGSVLRRPEISYDALSAAFPPPAPLPDQVREAAEVQVKYAGYIRKQEEQVRRFRHLEDKPLPADLDYNSIGGLSTEAQQKLQKLRPLSIGQAQRITGVSPADIGVLLVYLKAGQK